jgi:ubiquinone/menaquinone biosynthesis C-methylase UbiE
VRDGYVAELWDNFSAFAKDALELARVAPGSDVLDVCTGPGTLAVQAAASARRVVAVDFSPRMLEELRRQVTARDLHNVEAVEADGQALPFEDSSFDRAFSMFGHAQLAPAFGPLRRSPTALERRASRP